MIRLRRKPVARPLPSISPQSWKTDGPASNLARTGNQQLETGFHHSLQNWKKVDGRGKSPGSRRTQFKPGIEWTGNRGGRLPRPFRDTYRKVLAEINPETGSTYLEDIVRNIINVACSGGPYSVRAAIEIHRTLGLHVNRGEFHTS